MADDDSWLYGDDNEEEETPAEDAPLMPISKPEQEEVEAPPAVEPVEEEKDVEEEKAEEDNDSSDESDDDGINFTIDHVKINDAKESYKNMQLKKNSTTDPSFGPGHKEKKGKFNVEDFDNILTVNGQTAVEVDMESLEDKPWRKPGADITDYFNYGFTEETWAAYCNRQRRMRVNESGVGLALTGQTPILSNSKVLGGVNTNITTIGTIPTLGGGGGAVQSLGGGAVPGGGVDMSKIMSGPPPNNSSGGSLPVKKDEPSGITVMTHEKRIYSNKVLSAMDFSVPPPGFNLPPPGVPPPNIENNDFNPSDPFGEGDMMGGFEPTAQAQWSLPPPPGSWDQGGGHVTHGPPPELGDRYRDRRDRRDYDRRSRSRSPDRRRRRSRERDTRDRRDRDRDRDRDRGDRDRERDRDRDSDRERKVKKEKRSRSRSRSRSPRHKKSKKDKKERSDRDDRDSRETPNKIKEEAKD